MKRTIGMALVLVGAVAAVVGLWSVRGPALPRDHRLSRAGRYPSDRDAAWRAVSALDGAVDWRSDLSSRERQPDVRGHSVWRERWPDGETVTFETVERSGDRKLVRCVVDTDGPFGGCWTIEVSPRDAQSVVTVSEQLTVHDAWYARTHDVADRQERLDGFLRALGGPLGTPVLADTPRELREPVAR